MIKYTFIATSQGGRLEFFKRFILSLSNSKLCIADYEIIFVDQSGGYYDDFLAITNVNINIIESKKIALSKARNLALESAKGEYVFFSDDDADYSNFDFKYLDELVQTYEVVSFPLFIAPEGIKHYGNRKFPSHTKFLNVMEVFSLCLSLSIVIKRDLVIDVGSFNEEFGAGAIYGGSEETDLILRIYQSGYKAFYTPDLSVMHPQEYIDINYEDKCIKFHNYAIGYSKICRKYAISLNFIPIFELLRVTFYSLGGLLFSNEKKFYYQRIKGFLNGFF